MSTSERAFRCLELTSKSNVIIILKYPTLNRMEIFGPSWRVRKTDTKRKKISWPITRVSVQIYSLFESQLFVAPIKIRLLKIILLYLTIWNWILTCQNINSKFESIKNLELRHYKKNIIVSMYKNRKKIINSISFKIIFKELTPKSFLFLRYSFYVSSPVKALLICLLSTKKIIHSKFNHSHSCHNSFYNRFQTKYLFIFTFYCDAKCLQSHSCVTSLSFFKQSFHFQYNRLNL